MIGQRVKMSDSQYTAETFDEPLRALPLGHLDHDVVTLGDYVGGEMQGRRLHPDQVDAIQRIDPTKNLQDQPADERALIWWLANQGLIVLIQEQSPEQALDLIPVLRKQLGVEAELDDGYQIHVGGGPATFQASMLGACFIPHINGSRTLREVSELVRAGAVANGEDSLIADTTEGDAVAIAGLEVIASMLRVGAVSVDLAPSR